MSIMVKPLRCRYKQYKHDKRQHWTLWTVRPKPYP